MSTGSVITFYSYKGGVGRTFALANIAALLSTWGYKVLCIDWDLEAPGLHFYFKPWMQEQDRPGLVEFVQAHADGKKPLWRDYITNVRFDPSKPPLLFMKAGLQDETYVRRMQTLNWTTLYDEHNFGNFLEEQRNDWKQSLDFILVDSRTGISDIGGICTIQLPDLLVLLLTANNQSLSGSLDIVQRLRAGRANLPVDRGRTLIMPVISRFEHPLSGNWLDTFEEQLAPLYNQWRHRDVPIKELLNFTRIPSIPIWTFGEELPVIKVGTSDPDDVGFFLETLAALVAQRFAYTDVLVRNRDTFVDAAKNGARKIDEQPASPAQYSKSSSFKAPVRLFISYSGYDELFKRELEIHLSLLKRQNSIQTWSSGNIPYGVEQRSRTNAHLEEANIILLLISPDYLASPASDREIEQAIRRFQEGKSLVLPIILRPVDLGASPIGTMQPLPSDGMPITMWRSIDAALANVVAGIRRAIVTLQQSQEHP